MDTNMDKVTGEQKALQQFRSNLKDILAPDYKDTVLIKWLRAHNFNMKQAENLFRVNYYNRIIAEVDTKMDTYVKPEVVQKYETLGILGFAKDGSRIRYIAAGRFDLYGFIMSVSTFDLCLYFTYLMEMDLKALKEENEKTGKDINEVTFIIDLEGFSIQRVLHKCVIELGFEFTRLFQECYPEIWSYVLVINAPKVFDKVFNIFKPVLGSRVMDRIKVANKESSRELLLKYIDEDILPVFLGGKRVDSNGDPRCSEFITFGGKVPEKFYSANFHILLAPTDPDVKCVAIGPRSTYNHVVVIQDGGSRIRFQIRVENGSVNLTVLHKSFEPPSGNLNLPGPHEHINEDDEECKFKKVSQTIKAPFHCCQEDCLLFLKWPGIYAFKFSNAGSWFTSRKLLFRHTVIPPKPKDLL